MIDCKAITNLAFRKLNPDKFYCNSVCDLPGRVVLYVKITGIVILSEVQYSDFIVKMEVVVSNPRGLLETVEVGEGIA